MTENCSKILDSTKFVLYFSYMTNVTFKVEEPLIHKARLRAKGEHRSLNDVFVDWLKVYAGQKGKLDYYAMKEKYRHIKPGGPFTRDEMNER